MFEFPNVKYCRLSVNISRCCVLNQVCSLWRGCGAAGVDMKHSAMMCSGAAACSGATIYRQGRTQPAGEPGCCTTHNTAAPG